MLFLKKKRFDFIGYTYINLFKKYSIVILYKIIPVLVIYTLNKIPNEAAACTRFYTIRIKPRFKNDLSIVTHEIIHAKQIIRTGGIHYILYNFNNKYRYKTELEAYAYQCLHIIIASEIGLNMVLLDQLIAWVINILSRDMQFLVTLKKSEESIQKEFTSELVLLLKKYKDIL